MSSPVNSRRLKRRLLSVFAVVGLLAWMSVDAATMGVTTADVRVRSSPNGEPVDSLRAGTVIAFLDVSGTWVKVMYIGAQEGEAKAGWVSVSYVRMNSGRGAGYASGDDCESEYRTNAEVCVSVTDSSIECDKDYTGDSYRGCTVTLEYEVATDYNGGSYLDADVECEVEISYAGRNTYVTQSDSSTEDDSHSLYAGDSESATMTFDFSFISFQEVTKAQIASASCEVDSVDLW